MIVVSLVSFSCSRVRFSTVRERTSWSFLLYFFRFNSTLSAGHSARLVVDCWVRLQARSSFPPFISVFLVFFCSHFFILLCNFFWTAVIVCDLLLIQYSRNATFLYISCEWWFFDIIWLIVILFVFGVLGHSWHSGKCCNISVTRIYCLSFLWKLSLLLLFKKIFIRIDDTIKQ